MEGSGAGGKPLVQTPDDLRTHFGQVSPLAEKKVLYHLDRFCRDFIALSPFLVLASSDGKGNADASPRGDGPGFVAVLDDKTLLIPDRRGNNRVDTFGNILASPGVGLDLHGARNQRDAARQRQGRNHPGSGAADAAARCRSRAAIGLKVRSTSAISIAARR